MDAERIGARRARRMAKVYKERGRTRTNAVGKFLTDPLTGKKLFQIYGVDNATKLAHDSK